MKDIRERQLTAYNDDISSSTFMRYDEDNEGKDFKFTHKHNSMNNTTTASKKEGRESSKKRKHHKNRKLKPYQTMITN
jgi:hypothetical protein